MEMVFLVVQIVVAVFLVLLVLVQKTSSDGLGGLGGSNTGIISGRASSNFLTKMTAILAVIFMLNSLILAKLAANTGKSASTIEKLLEETVEHHHTPHAKEHDKKASDHQRKNQEGAPIAE